MTVKSVREYCRVAAVTPMRVASESAIRIAGIWIFSVSQPQVDSISPTDWLYMMLVPKSPRAMFHNHIP